MKKGLITIALSIVGMAHWSQAQTSAILPYTNDFESITSITDDTSWAASGTTISAITNLTYLNTPAMNTAYMGSPLSNAHDKVLSFSDATLTNSYNSSDLFVAIDTMLQPTMAQNLIYSDAVSNSQFSIAFVTNGIGLWHGVKTGSIDNPWPEQQTWGLYSSGATVSQGKWVRLTVTVNYQSLPQSVNYGSYYSMFQVKIDGIPITGADGYQTASVNSGSGGSWFITANLGGNPGKISSLTLAGTGMMDDLVVGTAAVADYVTPSHHIPYAWMTMTGVVTNDTSSNTMANAENSSADADDDGMPNWQEYFAGTAPTNPLSKLVILNQSITNGTATLQWLGTTNALAPYSVAMSTNLSDWSVVTNNIVRNEGTNTLAAPHADSSPAFYRVEVIK